MEKNDNKKSSFYQTYELKNIVYNMKLKWIVWYHAYDHLCNKKNHHIKNWGDNQVKLNLSSKFSF